MIGILKKIFTLAIGIICLPLTITISRAFYNQLPGLSLGSRDQQYFLWGVCSYVALHLFIFKPHFIYNLGHEVTHVLSTWLSFGKAKNMKVSGGGGSVQTSKSNFFINISPYFLPIYTLILCLAYFLLARFKDASPYAAYFVFFIGFTLAMHIIMTVDSLKTAQPDLIKTGYLFSLSLIYVINIIVVGFVISLIFSGFSFTGFFMDFCEQTRGIYTLIFDQLFGA
jgi:hypothetical protein